MNPSDAQARREGRAPGSVLIGIAGWLLALLGGGLLFVSFAAQYAYLLAARHQAAPSMVAALALDAGMIIFSLLALGLARAGKSARTERVLIMACAFGSAGMNYLAADVLSPRSVVAFVMPPLFLAVVADRVIAVIRRHVLAGDEASPWSTLGGFLIRVIRKARTGLLYALRFCLAAPSTFSGLRRMVLNAAPLPDTPDPGRGASAETHDLPPREGPVPDQVQTPPSDPRAGERPRPAAAAVAGSAPAEGLTAARDEFERELARDLIRLGGPLPGRNALAREPGFAHLGSEPTRRRAAARILKDARAGLNGHGDGA